MHKYIFIKIDLEDKRKKAAVNDKYLSKGKSTNLILECQHECGGCECQRMFIDKEKSKKLLKIYN